jgi:hypothetical protein
VALAILTIFDVMTVYPMVTQTSRGRHVVSDKLSRFYTSTPFLDKEVFPLFLSIRLQRSHDQT